MKAAERTVTIRNKLGLHVRPASLFVERASKFKSDIYIIKDGERVNGKSIMGVLSLAAEQGSDLTIRAEGEDCEEAVEALSELVEEGFYEE
ncbi:MAG: phosphocarrier protein HPr [Candidatus Latescibacterota bacterium]|nr:MAG: phosphocarrier protein HPr [Candidatus Latescibacterota bacterium]RKY64853.1 MAG: phosphocarrier protein HPr [Candidatus Latescibacterota bacterium]RKY74945.1 MAG: phosphocarrier protein HPr [Candidatus Latescibacterota bacterium]HDI00325.1 HPr family phosphocarrier protein [Bacillota bacterium]